jgi:hypothetical protein
MEQTTCIGSIIVQHFRLGVEVVVVPAYCVLTSVSVGGTYMLLCWPHEALIVSTLKMDSVESPPLVNIQSAPVEASAPPSSSSSLQPANLEPVLVRAYAMAAVESAVAVEQAAPGRFHQEKAAARRSIADALYSRPAAAPSPSFSSKKDESEEAAVGSDSFPSRNDRARLPSSAVPRDSSPIPARGGKGRDPDVLLLASCEPNVLKQTSIPVRGNVTYQHHPHARSESDLRSSLPDHLAHLSKSQNKKRDKVADALFRRSSTNSGITTASSSGPVPKQQQQPAPSSQPRTKPESTRGTVQAQASPQVNSGRQPSSMQPAAAAAATARRGSALSSAGSVSSGGSSSKRQVQTVRTTHNMADGTIRETVEEREILPNGSCRVIRKASTTRFVAPPLPSHLPAAAAAAPFHLNTYVPPPAPAPVVMVTQQQQQYQQHLQYQQQQLQYQQQQQQQQNQQLTAANNSYSKSSQLEDPRQKAERERQQKRIANAAINLGIGVMKAVTNDLNENSDSGGDGGDGGIGIVGGIGGLVGGWLGGGDN